MSEIDFLDDFAESSLWSTVPAKRRFQYSKELNAGMKESHRLALTMNGVVDRALDDAEGLQTSDFDGYQIFEEGDLAFKLIDLENIKTSRVGLVPRRGIMSPAYIRLRPSDLDGCFTPFYYWYFYAAYRGNIFNGLGGGIRQSLSQTELLNFPIPEIDYEDQVRISNYLEREIARIDQLISRKIGFQTLLDEKSKATAAHAITGGISKRNDTSIDAPAWLGQVPSYWRTVRIAELFQEIVRPADTSLPVLAVSIRDGVSDKELEDEDRARMVNLSEDRTKYQRVQPGDLVYNMMRAWQGAFGTVTVNGLVSPAYVVAEPKAEFRTKFIELQLRTASGAEEVRRYSKGIADFRQRLYWEHFRNLKVCLPPLKEQDDIIAHIESEQARLALLKTKTERSIELLREHRTALITAAVTGKIDVRNAA
ncbi:restriction endonuclease subunit S [Novosphingopyxis baekryungensis]|uniref:restriction endonuclease subunit S n=1 Tax=Novosphingopyxis baekryungensis TaxID=279369 RepID=UPI0003B54A5B|nr:restriction endonuclease subunit S [Novosphingopyxis baekryungensis]